MKPTKIHRPIQLAIVESLHVIFEDGIYADKVIERQFKSHREWGSRDRKHIAETVYDMVRWRRLISFCAGESLGNDHPSLWKALGIWKIISHKGDEASLRDTIWSIKEWQGLKFKDVLEKRAKADKYPAVRESIPDWLFELGKTELGEKWEDYLSHLNQQAPVFLRANTLKTDRDKVRTELGKELIETEIVPELPDALQLKERKNVHATESFKKGLFEMQDGASQQVAPLLEVEPGQRVIDACAGAGGKTLHIASFLKNKGKIIALDVNELKLTELKRRAARNGVDVVETKLIDSTKVIKRLEDSADRVLLDVPCSGLGVLRRNPDTKWKLTQEHLDEMRKLQHELLASYSKMTKKGGLMVYATCSVLPSENEKQVERFLAENEGWEKVIEKKFVPGQHGFDGFYACSLRRL